MRRAVDVVVIGAGMAGLTSVSDLLAHLGGYARGTSARPSDAPYHLNGFRFEASTTTGGLNDDFHAQRGQHRASLSHAHGFPTRQCHRSRQVFQQRGSDARDGPGCLALRGLELGTQPGGDPTKLCRVDVSGGKCIGRGVEAGADSICLHPRLVSPFVAALEQHPGVRLCQARDHDIADESSTHSTRRPTHPRGASQWYSGCPALLATRSRVPHTPQRPMP